MGTTCRIGLALISTEDGGRQSAIVSGYRSLIRFVDSEAVYGVEIDLDGKVLEPGSAGVASAYIWAASSCPNEIRFDLLEGARVVGTGKVLASG